MCQLNFKFVGDACWLKQIRNAKSGGVALNWQWSQALISLAWSKISSRLSRILTVITVIRRAARSWGRVFTNLWQQTDPSAFIELFEMQQAHQTVMFPPPHGAGGLIKGLCPLRQVRQSWWGKLPKYLFPHGWVGKSLTKVEYQTQN